MIFARPCIMARVPSKHSHMKAPTNSDASTNRISATHAGGQKCAHASQQRRSLRMIPLRVADTARVCSIASGDKKMVRLWVISPTRCMARPDSANAPERLMRRGLEMLLKPEHRDPAIVADTVFPAAADLNPLDTLMLG